MWIFEVVHPGGAPVDIFSITLPPLNHSIGLVSLRGNYFWSCSGWNADRDGGLIPDHSVPVKDLLQSKVRIQYVRTASLKISVSEMGKRKLLQSEVRMEQCRNQDRWKTADPQEEPRTSGVVWHDYHLPKFGSGPAGSARLLPGRSRFNPRPDRARRCRCSTDFLGDLPFRPHFQFQPCSIITSITIIGSQDLDVKSHPHLFTLPYAKGWSPDMIDCKSFYTIKNIRLGQYQFGSPVVDDRPIMNTAKYRTVSGVVRTNRTMVSFNTDTSRTGVLAVVDIEPTMVIEVSMEWRWNEGVGKTGDSRKKNPPTNGIGRHDSHLRKFGDLAGDRSAIMAPLAIRISALNTSLLRAAQISSLTSLDQQIPCLLRKCPLSCRLKVSDTCFGALEQEGRLSLSRVGPCSTPCDSIVRCSGGFCVGLLILVGIVHDDAAGRRVFSGISRFPRLFIPVLLHTHLTSPTSTLNSSMSGAAQNSLLTHYNYMIFS
ncbi:hypothetical protein PR048_015094, partial [Dryococelus australis]